MRERELALEVAEELPDREALALFSLNIAVVPQTNVANTITVLSPNSTISTVQANLAAIHF